MKTGKTKNGINLRRLEGVARSRRTETWVLVGNQAEARVFRPDEDNGFSLVRQFAHPEGKRKASSLVSDRPGRSFDSGRSNHPRGSGARHAYAAKVAPKDHAAEQFAETLAAWLAAGRKKGSYDKLLLVAEPRFLGKVKAQLDGVTARRLLPALERDFTYLTDAALFQKLEKALATRA